MAVIAAEVRADLKKAIVGVLEYYTMDDLAGEDIYEEMADDLIPAILEVLEPYV